jgi:hypothetical protein
LARIKAEDEHTLERTRKVREACAQASNAELRRFNRFRHKKSALDLASMINPKFDSRLRTLRANVAPFAATRIPSNGKL